MKSRNPLFLTDWFKLPQAIVEKVEQDIIKAPVQYEGCHIFGSYDKSSSKDIGLHHWATTTLLKNPGVQVTFLPRQKVTKVPCCTGTEHHPIGVCPTCNASMLGTQEKGVDTHIVIEMMDSAYNSLCDIIVLVSADKDFIPCIKKVTNKGIKTINAYIPGHGHQLSNECWARFDLDSIKANFQR